MMVPQYMLSHAFLEAPIGRWIHRAHQRTWLGRANGRLRDLAQTWNRRPHPSHLPTFVEYLSLLPASLLDRRDQTRSKFIRAATKHHAGRILVSLLVALCLFSSIAFGIYQKRESDLANRRLLVSTVDLMLHGRDEDLPKHIADLERFGDAAVEEIQPWRESVDPVRRFRAELFFQGMSPQSFAPFQGQLDSNPVRLREQLRRIARETPDGTELLDQVSRDKAATVDAAAKAAVLHQQITSDTDPLVSILSGSSSATRDAKLYRLIHEWCDDPNVLMDIALSDADDQSRYHAMAILCSYTRQELLDAGIAPEDALPLINSPAAAVHAASQSLAVLLGADASSIRPVPPANANWKLGPYEMPMVRIEAGMLRYESKTSAPAEMKQVSVPHSFWISEMPVSQSVFQRFVDEVDLLDDGRPNDQTTRIFNNIQRQSQADPSLPLVAVDYASAISFCNWLSRDQGLTPVYRFKETPKVLEVGPRLRPPIPWESVAGADGYRLPTLDQYEYCCRSLYQEGIPWLTAEQILRSNQSRPPDELRGDAIRHPRTSFPTRLGLFMQDMTYGSWTAVHPLYVAATPADTSLSPQVFLGSRWHDKSVFVVQVEN